MNNISSKDGENMVLGTGVELARKQKRHTFLKRVFAPFSDGGFFVVVFLRTLMDKSDFAVKTHGFKAVSINGMSRTL